MRKTVAAVAVSIAVGAGLLVPGAQATAKPPAAACTFTPTTIPTSTGFTAAEKAAPFANPAPKDHIAILDAFSKISAVTKQENLAKTVYINQTASKATGTYAINDNYDIGTGAIFNSLGSVLGKAFSAALAAGQLPKTAELLVGDDALIESRLGTSTEKKHFQNPRPFEIASPLIKRYSDGRPDLYEAVRGSGSYPSGHTTWGYGEAFIIAALFPELGPQILARGADYGYHRIVLGVHYPLDVIGGRIQAQASDAAVLGDPTFSTLVAQAKNEVRTVLAAKVGAPIATIVKCQQPYVSTKTALASYRERASYDFLPTGASHPIQVPAGAENLIRAAHPGLSTKQLRDILAKTALPAGNPLDKTGPNGGWQRLDLARAWVTK